MNIVFSALLAKGNSFEIFEANKGLRKIGFFAPEFLFLELGRRVDKLLVYTKFTKEEFSKAFALIKAEITLVTREEFADKLGEAKELNPKDAPYLALALKLGCPIISDDKGLEEQARVKVLSPSEALEIIYGRAPEQ